MSVSRPTLDADQLRGLLRRLGALAINRGVELDLVALGGAAIALLFDSRRTTRDIDLVEVHPSREVLADLAAQIAQEDGLSPRWLSDEAARYACGVSRGRLLFEAPGIQMHAVTLEQLLASKLDAMRDDVDRGDAVAVAVELGLARTSTELAIAPYVRPERYARACEELNDIWAEVEDARR